MNRNASFYGVRAITIAMTFCLPAAVAAAPAPLVFNATCTSAKSCVRITNFGSGTALQATAKSNSGSVGETLFALPQDPGLGIGIGGLLGIDLSGNASSADYSAGVFAYSKFGEGLLAVSPFSQGVVGVTGNNGSKSGTSTNGVVGLDSATDKSGFNNGVLGQSQYGYGVFGFGTSATDTVASVGVVGATSVSSKNSQHPGGVVGVGVMGVDASSDGGLRDVGVFGMSNGVGVVAIGSSPAQPAGFPTRPALRARCLNDGDAITGVSNLTEVFNFDCRGNLVLAGGITTRGATQIVTAVAGGPDVVAYAARTTRATIEDVGNSTLVNGIARVAFDASFSSAIDKRTPYLVFVTPSGDSRGLYVQKSATGFTVRENGGGRSNVEFDYRVVAKPLDTPSARLASASMLRKMTASDSSDEGLVARTRLMQHLRRAH